MPKTVTDETLTVAHFDLAADFYNRYPGEALTIYLRFTAPDLPDAKVQLSLPKVMEVESYDVSPSKSVMQPATIEAEQELIILIPLNQDFAVGQEYIVTVHTRIHTFYIDQFLIIQAMLLDQDTQTIQTEELNVAVIGKGAFLKYLPEIYESDDFTSRFLMLFESFWKPVSRQIDQMEMYFDPLLTPSELLPWLASWLGLPIDNLLPIERNRVLIQNAMQLSQRRGTVAALKKYLEIYSDGKVEITERRAKNFVLGAASLGVVVALGKKNLPNTVSIKLSVPEEELVRTKYSPEMYQRKMNEIVRSQIPAHVTFDLNCEFVPQPDPQGTYKRSTL